MQTAQFMQRYSNDLKGREVRQKLLVKERYGLAEPSLTGNGTQCPYALLRDKHSCQGCEGHPG